MQFLSPSGLFLVKGSVSKKSLGPNFVDNKLWFWKYSSNFLFFILATFGTSFALFRWCSHLKYDFFRSCSVRSFVLPDVRSSRVFLYYCNGHFTYPMKLYSWIGGDGQHIVGGRTAYSGGTDSI